VVAAGLATSLLRKDRGHPGPGAVASAHRRSSATSWAAALVLAFAVGLWAGGAAFTQPPAAIPAAAVPGGSAPGATPGGTAPGVIPTPAPVRIIRSVATPAKAIALTFDDGPSPTYTPMVLQLLQQYGAHATFFVIGQQVERYPQILKQEVDAGDEIGNHGYHHLTLKNVSTAQLISEVQTAEQTLVSLTGSSPTLYRLPGGKSDPAALRELANLGYKIVMWSIDTRDYVYRTPSAIVAQVEKQVAPGAIIIFHDGGGNQQHTVDALKTLLPWLKEQGYQMMTVSQLLEMPRATVTR
jgi:peptidoglycan/xylan/chitin deacetylase (PgdA/CDA1 family)